MRKRMQSGVDTDRLTDFSLIIMNYSVHYMYIYVYTYS